MMSLVPFWWATEESHSRPLMRRSLVLGLCAAVTRWSPMSLSPSNHVRQWSMVQRILSPNGTTVVPWSKHHIKHRRTVWHHEKSS